MKVTAMQEYGLRCMMQLVVHGPETPLTVREIAEKERLTPVYVEKLLVTLRRADLVKSSRGVNGGYALARPARETSVADVLSALGQVDLGGKNLCRRFTGTAQVCVHEGNCGIRPVWGMLTRFIYGFLSKINLEQLAQKEEKVTKDIEALCATQPVTFS
jgi:Rrf2 family transcriptional regulator, iron-sulfur cluster assembly transcription factor